MTKEKILNGSQFFSEVHTGFSSPVKIINAEGLGKLVGHRASVHLHSPATEKLGRPIYSVLIGGVVQGQTENIYLQDAKMRVDKRELSEFMNSASGGKTRNTFVSGVVRPATIDPIESRLKIRPGSITDANTGEDVSSGMSVVQLGPSGPKYRK